MKQLVSFILYGCIMLEYFCGPVISDPAPGRSPGPPTIAAGLSDSPDSSPNEHSSPSVSHFAKDVSSAYDNDNEGEEDIEGDRNDSNNNNNDNDYGRNTRAQKLIDLNAIVNDNATVYNAQTQHYPPSSPCSNIKKFLQENDIILKDKDNDHSKLSHFDVTHDVFTTAKGLIAGIKYKVQISKVNDAEMEEFFIESYIDDERPRGHFIDKNNVLNEDVNSEVQARVYQDEINRSGSYIDDLGSPETFNQNDNYLDNEEAEEEEQESKEEYENYNSECKKNIWIDKFAEKTNQLSITWRLNDNFDEESDNSTVYFRLLYRKLKKNIVYEVILKFPLLKDCKVYLKNNFGKVDNQYLPTSSSSAAAAALSSPSMFDNCTIVFPDIGRQEVNSSGILVELTRLNVACKTGGHLSFNRMANRKICGKLEELDERSFYFPLNSTDILTLTVVRHSVFEIRYKIIDFCYNMTISDKNHEILLNENMHKQLECNIKIHIPFGNIIVLNILIDNSDNNHLLPGVATSDGSSSSSSKVYNLTLTDPSNNFNNNINKLECDSAVIEILDYYINKSWRQCLNYNSDKSSMKKYSLVSSGNILEIKLIRKLFHKSSTNNINNNLNNNLNNNNINKHNSTIQLSYYAQPIETIVSQCAFGSIAINQFCISLHDNVMLSWYDAESECNNRGGHLLSIRSESDQNLIENFIMNSLRYNEFSSYWIGASDKNFEGDYRWSDGSAFSYSNWFPGWPSYDNYNKQPNDDGLSAQDCVELRKFFQQPTGHKAQISTAFAKSLMWNDRDCDTKNYFICESVNSLDGREQMEKPLIQDCNRTIELSRELPKTTVWSPGYPKYYPDNINCFTLISSPVGYRIVIDFEELIIENEPQCAYDYLVMFEPRLGHHFIRNPRHSNNNRTSYRRNQYFSNKDKNASASQTFLMEASQKYLVNFSGASLTNSVSSSSSSPNSVLEKKTSKRICGDWSSKIKLLRYMSKGQSLGINFVTDYSHHFGGYKAKVAIESVNSECSDDRLKAFNGSCYLFISYPEVDWKTAQQICSNIGAQLASITSMEEQRFIISNIRNHIDYTPRALYWLGGKHNSVNNHFEWYDGNNMNFQGWLPGAHNVQSHDQSAATCLGIQWTISPNSMVASGLYWQSHKCVTPGGYICKRKNTLKSDSSVRNNTIVGRDGRITSPNYPNNYVANLDYWIQIISPESNSRIIVQFQKVDLEYQEECLYDFISIENVHADNRPIEQLETDHVQSKRSLKEFMTIRNMHNESGANYPLFMYKSRLCGFLESNMSQYDFISQSNEVKIHFHSDFSLSYSGYSATWSTVDLTGCPIQTITSREGYISSPNFPYFLLNNLNCTYVIKAPKGKRIWVEFLHYDIRDSAAVHIDNGFGNSFVPFEIAHHVNDGIYLSKTEQFVINLETLAQPRGKGFRALFKTIGEIKENRNIYLANSTEKGFLLNLNYPQQPIAAYIDYTQHLIAPLGEVILLELYGVGFTNDANDGCRNNSFIEIKDNYADTNGTSWILCKLSEEKQYETALDTTKNSYSAEYKLIENHMAHAAPIYIISYLNTLHVRQKSFHDNIKLNATVRLQSDISYKMKLISTEDWVETCEPNPCQFGGKCLTSGEKKVCQCRGHYAGRFCRLNLCEFEPCLFGKCELTTNSFKCYCQPGYSGRLCDQKQKPCADNPCESRGECFDKNGVFSCRCHAWWEGQRCEKRITKIPFKPLSERMLQEPFWLGLITVFFVLAIIGLVWCAKRHFPEKIEKLLADEADRNRSTSQHSTHHYHHHNASLREQLQATAGTMTSSTVTTPGAPKSIFGRLGIRKPSILSLSSPQPIIGGSTTARTFSLDDLLRPPPRRTPSPRKKRNNSTPSKKNPAEKKQILQQLIASAPQNQTRINLDELIQLSDQNQNSLIIESEPNAIKETSLIENANSNNNNNNNSVAASIKRQISDPKLEKKVTFARLLSKVSAEMNSSSDVDIGNGNKTSSALSLPVEVTQRANSVPPSPCTNDTRSPNSTSSNQGFDSLSSSELALNDMGYKHNSLTNNNRRIRSKMTSADSILAMFKSYAISNGGLNSSSPIVISPSTTPDELMVGDDESSTSSIHTPVSYSSGPPDSPVFYRQSKIEVPVLDVMNVHSSAGTNLSPSSSSSSSINASNSSSSYPLIHLEIPNMNNKCLSPIREMPTPIPSPALTPVMSRMRTKSILHDETMCVVTLRNENEDIKKTDIHLKPHIVIDMLPEIVICDTFNSTPTANKKVFSSYQSSTAIAIDVQPPTPERAKRPRDLIIPSVKIDEPSPTKDKKPYFIFPGSPPPHRSSKKSQQSFDKPSSLDLPFIPPTIVIDEVVCPDTKSIMHPSEKASFKNGNNGSNNAGSGVVMCYLSPFSICAREDRAPSESNLSSSGYSSMTSPGPSRCGSNNPLYPPGDTDDTDNATASSHTLDFRIALQHVKNNREDKLYGKGHERKDTNCNIQSDSETMSNDEGIGTDHLEEKLDEKELKLKELEQSSLEDTVSCKSQLQLPTVVVQKDSGSEKLSPVSSRSESPLSIKRFSTSFYGKKDQQLLFTDSDGLYDFPSSDGKGGGSTVYHRKISGKKRERKLSRSGLIASPTKVTNNVVETPKKDGASPSHPAHQSKHPTGTVNRKNPKRRSLYRQPITSSSSSTESLSHDITQCMLKSPLKNSKESQEVSDNGIVDADALPKILCEGHTRSQSKLSKLRAIGHQIRFLKRLEQSIQKRNKTYLQNESNKVNTEDEFSDSVMSPKITSPLLPDTSSTMFPNKRKSKPKDVIPNIERNSMESDF